MEDIKKAEIRQYIVDNLDLFEYKQELAADVKNKYIFGPYGENEHYNIDTIWEIVQEVISGIVPPVIPVEITDTAIIDKLLQDGIVEQSELDKAKEDLILENTTPIIEEVKTE